MNAYRLIAILLMAAGACSAESGLATASQGDLAFSIDTAVFHLVDSDTLALEIYEYVPIGQLARNAGDLSSFQTDAVLVSPSGDTLNVRQWISETGWSEDRSVVNSTIMAVGAGDFTLFVTITDLSNGRRGTASRQLSMDGTSAMSELEIANTVMPAVEESQNPFRKGGLVIFPAADSRFDLPGEWRAFIYSEIYGLGGETVLRQSRLTDASGTYLFARPWDSIEIPEGADAVGLLDSLDLSAARISGLHYLETAVITRSDTLLERKPIMIMREVSVAEADPVFEPGSASEYLPQFYLLLGSGDRAVMEGLDGDEARVAYYESYWTARPGMRADFEARCREATSFTTIFREGWRTDRGRVYIKFGRPDDIDRMPLQIDTLPYEVWTYSRQGTETFVFVDSDGTGNFIQVYSSVAGEPSYSNWQDMLSPIGAGMSGDEE